MGKIRNRLPEILLELGWTQRELARKAKVSEQTITNLMKPGTRSAQFETLENISEATGYPLTEILVQEP